MTIKNYTTGLVLSLALTLLSFGMAGAHLYSGHQHPTHATLFTSVIVLALVQLAVQMAFFLHVGGNSKRRDLVALAFAGAITLLVVVGSLWIMANLNHTTAMPFEATVTPQTEL